MLESACNSAVVSAPLALSIAKTASAGRVCAGNAAMISADNCGRLCLTTTVAIFADVPPGSKKTQNPVCHFATACTTTLGIEEERVQRLCVAQGQTNQCFLPQPFSHHGLQCGRIAVGGFILAGNMQPVKVHQIVHALE